jgi:hypothetical protein
MAWLGFPMALRTPGASGAGATAQHSAWRQAGHIFAAAAPDVVTCGTLIAVLGRSRSWRRAFQALMDVTQVGKKKLYRWI